MQAVWALWLCAFVLTARVVSVHAGTVPRDIPADNRVGHLHYPMVPADFHSAIGWIDVIHDWRGPGGDATPSRVEIRKAELWACVSGTDIRLPTTGITHTDGRPAGGLYTRGAPDVTGCDACMPWFHGTSLPIPSSYSGGILTVHPDTAINMIWHFWNEKWPRVTLPAGTQSVYFKVEARITGPAVVRAGFDWWSDSTVTTVIDGVTHREGGATDWRFASANWETLNVGLPCAALLGVEPGRDGALELDFASPAANPSTGPFRLSYVLPRAGRVDLAVLDASGRRVVTLARDCEDAGAHALEWDGRDERGHAVGPGVYFARLQVGANRLSRKLVLER